MYYGNGNTAVDQQYYEYLKVWYPETASGLQITPDTDNPAQKFERIFMPLVFKAILDKLGPRWQIKILGGVRGLKDITEVLQFTAAIDNAVKDPLTPPNPGELKRDSEFIGMLDTISRNTRDMYQQKLMYVTSAWKRYQYGFVNPTVEAYIGERLKEIIFITPERVNISDRWMIEALFMTPLGK